MTIGVISRIVASENKLAKARKMRKPPGTLILSFFGPGRALVQKSLGPKYLY